MPRLAGYLQLRRAIFEHVRDGRLTHLAALAYIYMASQADTRDGVWIGSAGALAGELCIRERTARDVIERLSRLQYIRRFPVPGRHICYPVLINKYLVTDGEHAGHRLNAAASQSWNQLVFDKNGDSCEHGVEQGVKHGAAQKRIENGEEKQRHAAARPSDPRFQPFFEYAYESFSSAHGTPPAWGKKDGAALKALLGRLPAAAVTLEDIKSRWDNFAESTEEFTCKQGGSLAYFCSAIDRFMHGPIFYRPPNGRKGYDQTTTDQNIERVLGSPGRVAQSLHPPIPS